MFPKGVPKRGLFKDIARLAADVGFITLRYDKRASGKSEGSYADTDLEVLAKDIVAVFTYAKTKLPPLPIGLLGQSKGGLTVLRSFELGAKADFLILQGASLEPLEIFLAHQKTRAAAPFLGKGNDDLKTTHPYLAAFYNAIYNGDMLYKIKNTTEAHYPLKYQKWEATTSLSKYRQNQWNGLEKLRNIFCPTLVVFGSEDANVRPEAARKIQREQQNKAYSNVQVKILDGLEHSFRKAEPGENFISAMAKPLSDQYISVLKEFLRERTR